MIGVLAELNIRLATCAIVAFSGQFASFVIFLWGHL
jgi:hypothetical protein